MSQTDSNENGRSTAARRDGSKFGVATMLVVAAVATVTQLVAIASLGGDVPWGAWSTGGALALIAGIWTGVSCRNWATWRRWIWVPVVLAIVVSFLTINLQAAAATSERQSGEDALCASTNADLAQAKASLDDVLERSWVSAGGSSYGSRPDGWVPKSGEVSEWVKTLREAGGVATPQEEDGWPLYEQLRGPSLEAEMASLEQSLAAACPTQ